MSCLIGRIIQFNEAIQYKSKISILNAEKKDIISNCKFSWSTDGTCWSGWTTYINYQNICKNIETDFYLRILFYDNLSIVYLNDEATTCYSISIYEEPQFVGDFCSDPNLFQPYNNLDCALLLQQQMADSIICMFGIPIYYFKVDAIPESLDVTFKEFTLHNVVAVKQIKLMIEDGQMPSSNYKLTEFDFDWETGWETEISKTQFATAFGDTAFPNQNDFVYIPMMKRMWMVNAAYDEKQDGLMWRSTTWKLTLIKYSDSSNVNTNEFESVIDGLLNNEYMKDVFPLETIEQHRQVGADPFTSPTYASTSIADLRMSDAVRKSCSEFGVNISEQMVCQRNNVIARNVYSIQPDAYITYQNGICGSSGTLSFILYNEMSGTDQSGIHLGEVFVNLKDYSIDFNGIKCELDKQQWYLVVCRWNKNNYTTDLIVYKQTCRDIDKQKPVYMVRPEMYWFDLDNPIFEQTSRYNLDFEATSPKPCYLMGPINVTNIKVFNTYLSKEEYIAESLKYVTNNKRCIINDLARPISAGYGYPVK